MMTREELLAIEQALDDAMQQIRVGHIGTSLHCLSGAQAIVRAELQREDRMWDRVRTAIQESDEAAANMGGMLCPDVCDANVVTHAFAPPAHDASECVKDEPPSRPA